MKRSSIARVLLLVLFLVVPVLLLTANFLRPTAIARGKSAAIPLSGKMTPEQEQAQQLALDDALVMAHTAGHRSEVFGVRSLTAGDYPALQGSCANADCRQVEIYNFDENAAVTAVVNLDTATVLDVFYLPGMQPGINKRLADRALEIAFNAPEVISALGYRPTNGTMAPVPGGMLGTACAEGHLCVGPNFKVDDRFFWAIIDLTDDRLAGTFWTFAGSDASVNSTPFVPEGCPPAGSVNRDGWSLNHEVTGTDGLRVYNVTYNGVEVLTSVKLVEWHADYGSGGFEDTPGCGGGGGGFPIFPYGDTEIRDLMEGGEGVVGFEVVQDFRMSSWGSSCNYRYDQHIQFYNDGRFRVVSGAYGKGCGNNAIYRPVVRIDIAVDGDDNDNFAYYDGSDWVDVTTEDIRVAVVDPDFPQYGQHYTTPENYSWRVADSNGLGYNIEQDLGQLPVVPPGVPSRGDEPFVYFTLHHPSEGDGDMGVIGDCCQDNHFQGPEQFVNGESVVDTNIVLWYVPQMVTDVTAPDLYCWTITGEPNPETYPCLTGPMFHPIGSQTPDFAMTTTPASQDICVSENALYTVSTEGLGGFVGNIDLSAVGNPGTATFVPDPVPAGDPSTLTISGATAGNYTFDVVGDNGSVQHENSVSLNVFASAPAAPALLSPPNGATDVPTSPTYTWNPASGATSYFIEVATDAGFTNVVDSATTTETSYNGSLLAEGTTHYWRVSADNACGDNTSAVWSFTTSGVADIGVDPTGMASTQNTNTVVIQMLDISNLGTVDLDWSIDEVNGTLAGGSCDAPVDIPWLSLNPDTGTTPPAGASTVDVTFDSTGYAAGSYSGDLCIFSNDPDEPLVIVPVVMNVEQPTDVGVSGFGGGMAGGNWLIWLAPVALLAAVIFFIVMRQRGKHQEN